MCIVFDYHFEVLPFIVRFHYIFKTNWVILRKEKCTQILHINHRVPTQTGKPGKMEKLFPVREKSGNFVQTGKVREIWTKYWKSQGNLGNFYFLCYF